MIPSSQSWAPPYCESDSGFPEKPPGCCRASKAWLKIKNPDAPGVLRFKVEEP